MSEDVYDLINLKRRLDVSVVLDYPILQQCTECNREWYSEDVRCFCEHCCNVVGCVVFCCPSCVRLFVHAVPDMTGNPQCEHCRSNEIIREGHPDYPYMTQEEYEKFCATPGR